MTETAATEKKPIPKGRKWAHMNEKDFVRKFPMLGKARLARRAAKKKRRGRKKRPGPARIYRYPDRAPPSRREGAKFVNVTIPLETSLMLKELSKFYKRSMSSIVTGFVSDAFDEAYKEAELLARIEANRKKEDETPDSTKPRRRYNV